MPNSSKSLAASVSGASDIGLPCMGPSHDQTRNDSPQPHLSRSFGLLKRKPFVEAFAHKVELRAVDVGHALGVYQHLDAMFFEHHVFAGNSSTYSSV
jgi:hypothetical protein